MTNSKIYAAVFTNEEGEERIEYFCDKDLAHKDGTFDVSQYANDFLMHQGETLEDILEEEPITDPKEIEGILGEVLNFIRDCEEEWGTDAVNQEMRQRLEKLLVSHVATT